MSKTKKRRSIEIYEEYWKFTASWTNIYGDKFENCLRLIITYIDTHKKEIESCSKNKEVFTKSSLYTNLQRKIVEMCKFQGGNATLSARKAINMFVKIGFVNPFLDGYHPLAKKFLKERERTEQQITFSKIFYESSSLASDVTLDNRELNHIGFFLQTLDKNKTLSLNDLRALMVTDITKYKNGYLTRRQLDSQYSFAKANEFDERKYNQISHLKSYLQNFVDLKYSEKEERFWFADDPDIVDKELNKKYKRDLVRHRLYRNELKEEAIRIYGDVVCFFEKKKYKRLQASHIKPCQVCLEEHNDDEAYDVNNGLLLCSNVDAYFDKFDVTFGNDGKMIFGKKVPVEIRNEFSRYCLDTAIMTEKRKEYLEYHRKVFKEKEKNRK